MPSTTISVDTSQTWYSISSYVAPYASLGVRNNPGQIGNDTSNGLMLAGLLFKIPFDLSTADITSAFLQLYHGVSNTNISLIEANISAHDVDSSVIPTSRTNLDLALAELTTANILWTGSLTTSTGNHTSPDIKDVINEILNRIDWVADNYVVIYIITSQPTTLPAVWDFLGDSNAKLILNYDVPTPAPDGNHVEHSLTFEQFITVQINRRDVYSDVTPDQTISYTRVYNPSLQSVVVVDQDVNHVGSKNETYEDILVVTQTISYLREYNPTVESIVDPLQDILVSGAKFRQVIHELDPLQDITKSREYNRTVEDEIDANQDIHCSPIYVVVTHSLTPAHDIDYTGTFLNPQSIESTFDIEQDISYSGTKGRVVESILTVGQLVMVTGKLASNITGNTLSYPISYGSVAASGYQTRDIQDPTGPPATPADPVYNKRPDTNPNVTKTEDSPLPDFVYYETIVNNTINTPTTNTVLEYPVVSPTSTVTLPNPLFGNREELQVTRIQRKTLGGDLKVLSDANWPRIRTLRFQFEGISDSLLDSYNTFLLLSLGLEIKLTDYEGRVWHGFIVTPETESTDTGPTTCDNTLGFEFIGVEQQ